MGADQLGLVLGVVRTDQAGRAPGMRDRRPRAYAFRHIPSGPAGDRPVLEARVRHEVAGRVPDAANLTRFAKRTRIARVPRVSRVAPVAAVHADHGCIRRSPVRYGRIPPGVGCVASVSVRAARETGEGRATERGGEDEDGGVSSQPSGLQGTLHGRRPSLTGSPDSKGDMPADTHRPSRTAALLARGLIPRAARRARVELFAPLDLWGGYERLLSVCTAMLV